LPLLCGFETWFFKLRVGHGLRFFVNRLARKIFEPKGENVSGRERKLHNLKLRDIESSPNVTGGSNQGR